MKLSRIIAATLVASAVSAPAMAGGLDTYVNSGANVNVKLYGQLNRELMWADNGEKKAVLHLDNKMSGTRAGFKIKAKVDDTFSLGGRWEIEYLSNPSNGVDIDGADVRGKFSERKLEVWAKYDGWKVTAGQGSFASDGTGEKTSFDKLGVAMHPKVQDGMGDFTTRNNIGAGMYAVGEKLDHYVSNIDGLGRGDRIRVDTPSFSGFKLAASTGTVDKNKDNTDVQAWDVALRYAGEFGAIRVAGAASYSDQDTSSTDGSYTVSLALASGPFSIMGVHEETDNVGRMDHQYQYIRGAYTTKEWCKWGATSVGVEFGQSENHNADKEDGEFWGVGAVQKIKPASSELYVAYRNFSFDNPAENVEDFTTAIGGMRIKF